jgi:parallel beta helix pectate lyase-like protein
MNRSPFSRRSPASALAAALSVALIALATGGCGSGEAKTAKAPPPPTRCEAGAAQVRSAAGLREAVEDGEDACVTAAIGDVALTGLGSRAGVTISSEGGAIGHLEVNEVTDLTIRAARLRSVELWYADGTAIEGSRIGGTPRNRTEDNLVNVNVSPGVTIRRNEIAWTLAGTSGFAGYGIRSPGNSLGFNERLKIEGNYIHNIAADAIQGMGGGRDVVIDRNRIDYVGQEPASDEHADAIQVIDHGPGMRITNNRISHEGYFSPGHPSGGSGTLYVHGGSGGSLLIENNLFSDSLGRVLIGGLGTGGDSISNLTVRRNTFLEDGQSYTGFPGFHWAATSGANNLVERNVAQDEDGGFANQGSLAIATWAANLWRDSDTNALAIDAAGNCTSTACNPVGQEAIGYRRPTGLPRAVKHRRAGQPAQSARASG